MKKDKIKKIAYKTLQFLFNPRLLLCLGISWLITNGWSYIMFALGTYFKNKILIGISGAYLTFLWLPISPEKLVTFAIAIFLLRKLFPNDTKTLAVLRNLHTKAKNAINKSKDHKN